MISNKDTCVHAKYEMTNGTQQAIDIKIYICYAGLYKLAMSVFFL